MRRRSPAPQPPHSSKYPRARPATRPALPGPATSCLNGVLACDNSALTPSHDVLGPLLSTKSHGPHFLEPSPYSNPGLPSATDTKRSVTDLRGTPFPARAGMNRMMPAGQARARPVPRAREPSPFPAHQPPLASSTLALTYGVHAAQDLHSFSRCQRVESHGKEGYH
jgi:hypothetical protein